MSDSLLMLVVAPSLEEAMVDVLLTQTDVSGFTSSQVYAHGTQAGKLSLLEQVTGRQQKIQFLVYGTEDALKILITYLSTAFNQADISYVLLPVLVSGVI